MSSTSALGIPSSHFLAREIWSKKGNELKFSWRPFLSLLLFNGQRRLACVGLGSLLARQNIRVRPLIARGRRTSETGKRETWPPAAFVDESLGCPGQVRSPAVKARIALRGFSLVEEGRRGGERGGRRKARENFCVSGKISTRLLSLTTPRPLNRPPSGEVFTRTESHVRAQRVCERASEQANLYSSHTPTLTGHAWRGEERKTTVHNRSFFPPPPLSQHGRRRRPGVGGHRLLRARRGLRRRRDLHSPRGAGSAGDDLVVDRHHLRLRRHPGGQLRLPPDRHLQQVSLRFPFLPFQFHAVSLIARRFLQPGSPPLLCLPH